MQFDPRINNCPQFTQMGGGMKPDPTRFRRPRRMAVYLAASFLRAFQVPFRVARRWPWVRWVAAWVSLLRDSRSLPLELPGGPQNGPGPQEAGALPELRPGNSPADAGQSRSRRRSHLFSSRWTARFSAAANTAAP